MNKKLQTVISVFALAFILLIPGISAKAGTISTVNATGADSVINVSGSAGSGVVSVVILVYDETGTNLVMMQSTEVKDDHSFADVISASVGNYVVKVADYDGGAFAETTVTVSQSSVPEPQPEPEPTPTPEPTPEPQP
ncbi:MAG: hypothetical protein K6G30_05535, partial [Acetatifactor sp.]|nr:hypothetical protein [Acetatifactor sp.]